MYILIYIYMHVHAHTHTHTHTHTYSYQTAGLDRRLIYFRWQNIESSSNLDCKLSMDFEIQAGISLKIWIMSLNAIVLDQIYIHHLQQSCLEASSAYTTANNLNKNGMTTIFKAQE
uniref:Uncharacterized protein n=1 Tax=Octopus bimaculoides TaxID=37653 RepID=A0A0L8FGN7_OCTBM